MINNNCVVITGAAGLIGRAFSQTVIQNNGYLVATDIDNKGLQQLKKQLGDANAKYLTLDITKRSDLLGCIDEIEDVFGKIDALVNCVYPRTPDYGDDFFKISYEDFCAMLNQHVGGYFLACQQFSSFFLQQGYGNIINVASIYGLVPPRFEIYENTGISNPVEYSAIKSGIIHMSKYMAKLFKDRNIRVNVISPGGVEHEQSDVFKQQYRNYCLSKGMLSADDLCGALTFLLSDMSKYVNGQNIVVDDGFTL